MSEPEAPLENMVLDFSAKDPVCGMTVDPPQARGKAQYRGDTYFFCSPDCMQKFMASPSSYRGPANWDGPRAPAVQPAPRKVDKDPVCGMNVDPAKAASSAEYERKLYHFCSRGCAEKFRRDPEKYLSPNYKPAGMTGTVQMGGAPVQIGAARPSGKGSRLWDERRPGQSGEHRGPRRQNLLLLLRWMRREVQGRARKVSFAKWPASAYRDLHRAEIPSGRAPWGNARNPRSPRHTFARWIRRSGRTVPELVRSVAWRWSRSCRRLPRPPNGLAPCIPRLCAMGRARARSAAWRWSR